MTWSWAPRSSAFCGLLQSFLQSLMRFPPPDPINPWAKVVQPGTKPGQSVTPPCRTKMFFYSNLHIEAQHSCVTIEFCASKGQPHKCSHECGAGGCSSAVPAEAPSPFPRVAAAAWSLRLVSPAPPTMGAAGQPSVRSAKSIAELALWPGGLTGVWQLWLPGNKRQCIPGHVLPPTLLPPSPPPG